MFYIWKRYKFNKYINHLIIDYCNHTLPYMKYYIENELFDENKNKETKIGYMNKNDKLIWYKLK